MSDIQFAEQLEKIVGVGRLKVQEPMRAHTTFRIGGPADYFVTPGTREQVQSLIRLCGKEQMPYCIIGNGSNLLVGDKGVRGVVIQIYRMMGKIEVDGCEIRAQAGALLSGIAERAAGAGLGGLEFASGIPGTVGGACVMNAGAYGREMKDVLKEVTVLTHAGAFLTIPAARMELGYRTSILARKGYIVTDVVLNLGRRPEAEVRARMDELRARRVSRQPLEYPSAGSAFKRPEGYFAGKLIQDSGLQGFRVGDAQVSEKHCGFIINRGQATAEDVRELIRRVTETVKGTFGVELEPEIRRLGEFE